MNTGFLGSAVATVLTVYGIETQHFEISKVLNAKLQQYLPFTVLKPKSSKLFNSTLYKLQQYLPFTVLKHE